ncbi:MAG TPA: CopG family antitoxin [Pyrinomonadaceae bacterium]|nr:CopG family antitoxin [Pyrinomonadaceae bacterium]HMP66595.1 CopG family antitoxin [Pyrinomonadaceae bacterium]
MAKKRSESSVHGEHRNANLKPISDKEIDFSDIPESTAEELARAARVGRPSTGKAKQMIAFRIDPKLLSRIRKLAAKRDTPYQSFLHELLEDAVERTTA